MSVIRQPRISLFPFLDSIVVSIFDDILVKLTITVLVKSNNNSTNIEAAMLSMIMTMIYQAIAGPDLEHMRTEPRLFPGKADDHLLAQVKCH